METNLQESLDKLRSNLGSGTPVDPELHGLLQQLDGDIQAVLARREQAELTAAERAPIVPDTAEESATYGLAERTQEISAKFAAEHPKLEPALRELGTLLSNMGI